MGIAGALVGPLAGLIALTRPAGALLPARPAHRTRCRVRRRRRQRRRGSAGGWYRLAHADDAAADAGRAIARDGAARRARASRSSRSASPASTHRAARARQLAGRRHGAPPRLPRRGASRRAYAVVRGARGRRAPTRAAARALPDAALRAAAAPARPGTGRSRGVGRAVPRPAARSGSSASMRALPGDAPVGGATAQFLDQKHAIGSRPAARDRPALRRRRSCCSTSRHARSCCR